MYHILLPTNLPVYLTSPISKLPRQTTLNFTPSRLKSPQLPVTRLAALPAGSREDTPIHPQFIVCRCSEQTSLSLASLISLVCPPSVFFNVNLDRRTGLHFGIMTSTPPSTSSSASSTPAAWTLLLSTLHSRFRLDE